MQKVLVTGASGFIGRQVIASLAGTQADLVAFGRGNPPTDFPKNVQWKKVDLLKIGQEELLAVCGEVRAKLLVHLAWETKHGSFWDSPDNLQWVRASQELARAFVAAGGTRITATGTCVEYDYPEHGPCSEASTPIHPKHLYGVTKNVFRCSLKELQETSQCSYGWARVFIPFGPHEKRGRLVPSVINALLCGRKAECTAGLQLRDFMDVRDCGAAIAALAMSRTSGEVNIGSGCKLQLAEFVSRIGELMGLPELVRLGALPMRSDDPSNLWPDVSRLQDEVGFASRYGLDEAIQNAITWWESQHANREIVN